MRWTPCRPTTLFDCESERGRERARVEREEEGGFKGSRDDLLVSSCCTEASLKQAEARVDEEKREYEVEEEEEGESGEGRVETVNNPAGFCTKTNHSN